jgi:DNA-binding transcriptional LysR family regulator
MIPGGKRDGRRLAGYRAARIFRQRIVSRPGTGPGFRPAQVEFRDLRYFAVMAEELHFGRAAARLYITQPGLSQAIARLERELEVRLFTRARGTVELTEAGTELLHHARRLLAGLDGAVARVRMTGRGQAGLIRVGVAHLAEPAVAPALAAFQAGQPSIVIDRSAMLSERLLEQLAEGRLHAAVVHQVPGLAAADQVVSEPLRRGRLAVLAGPQSEFAGRPMVTLSELADQTFLVNPRALAPGAFEGLKLMCREFGGFEAKVLESAAASTVALDTSWRPIRDGTAIAVMAEATARALRADGAAVVPVQPPPQYVLALAWRRDEQAPAAHQFLAYLRCYRDRHAWITGPQLVPPAQDRSPSLSVARAGSADRGRAGSARGTKEGLASARARGRAGGRKPKLSARQAKVARGMYAETGSDGKRRYTVDEIAGTFAVSRKTIYRHLQTDGARRQPDKSTRPRPVTRPGDTGATSPAITPAAPGAAQARPQALRPHPGRAGLP